MADWPGEHTRLHFIPPGQPWRNGYIESFNSRVRDECLNINMFWSLVQARALISDWKEDYNHRRRHPRSATRPQRSTLQPAPTHDRLSLTAAPMSSRGVGGGPAGLARVRRRERTVRPL
jgi:putative transposase